ncbi:MAG: hypothetical protein AUH86_08060 [Acidobacteria bacterium 13_1_40CM_4_58_4]|nr:MAG: hypothetical protein AUH86_08060 [Acidobacteria bacterium 13_1_40CM_4_58_4]
MNFLSNPKFLSVYSAVLTVTFAIVVLGAASSVRNQKFGIITARRINIVEPDGTVRLTISNRADFPGAWNRKKEYPRPDRREAAGMLFMSEEGTEQGGFIWGASQLPDGTIQNHGHLSLDQYEENQIFAIDAGQEGNGKFSRITMTDQGDFPIEEKRKANEEIDKLPLDKQDAAWDKFFASHRHDVQRLALGRSPDGSVGLKLRDGAGRVRIVLTVQADGKPVLQFLNGQGTVVREFATTEK